MSQALHYDQLICGVCQYREISKHNKHCPNCPGITMAYESAVLKLEAARRQVAPATKTVEHRVKVPPKPPGQEEVPGQMSLFGGIVA